MHQPEFEPATRFLCHCMPHVIQHASSHLKLEDYYFANGVYTDVWRGNLDSRTVAVKIWRGVALAAQSREPFVVRLCKKLDTWKQLRHPNIVPFIGVMACRGPLPALILPYYANGNVVAYLAKNPSADILYLLRGLAAALSYIHALGAVHGGVRSSNVLVNDAGEACLTDIGTNIIPSPQDWTLINREGARWMAPEVMDPGPSCESSSDEDLEEYIETAESDVYSFSMTALEMYTGRLPFAHRRFYGGVVFDVIRGLRPPRPSCSNLTDDIWTVIQSCWHQNPKQRPSIKVVISWLDLLAQIRP